MIISDVIYKLSINWRSLSTTYVALSPPVDHGLVLAPPSMQCTCARVPAQTSEESH